MTTRPTEPDAPVTPLPDVVDLAAVGTADGPLVGGKAAGLGALVGLDGVRVPPGVCITTAAWARVVGPALAALAPAERDDPAAVRAVVGAVTLPDDLVEAIAAAVGGLGDGTALAVRSSATAEDLPTASFAGQQDSFLGLVGVEAVLVHLRRCWASLFTDRAVAYRRRADVDEATVAMAVLVQRMVPARAAGVLFTADPVSGDRTVTTIEAVAGLGDALVSGAATPETVVVRGDHVGRTGAGPVLGDEEVRALVALGRRVEAHAGRPQDIEWCLDADGAHVVQARAITTLFPPPGRDDDGHHVYVSVGHQQMMTDAMRPLGLSVFRLGARATMHEAGGRLWVDVTAGLSSPATRDAIVAGMRRSDPLIGAALQAVVDRGDFLPTPPEGETAPPLPPGAGPPATVATDPAFVARLVQRTEAAVAALAARLDGAEGLDVFATIRDDVEASRSLLFDADNLQAILAGMEAVWWLDEHLEAWLGEKGAGATLIRAAPGDVTAEMGLALYDVADAVRPHPEVVAHLTSVEDDEDVLAGLDGRAGGAEARAALEGWLAAYGMRCPGEIDVTRPRWRERPTALLPTLLGHVRNLAPGEHGRRVAEGRRAGAARAADLEARLRAGPDGDERADEMVRVVARARNFIGYREHPKFGMVCRFTLYRDALWREADRLVAAGALRHRDDIGLLTFDEAEEAVRTGRVEAGLVARRAEAFRRAERLVPPRVLTSHGEGVVGSYDRTDVPPGALVGLAVAAGTVEGRARVVLDLAEADLEPGDVLVTPFTDPGWTPVFATIAALVTEVGGSMTHGAVVAREYGLAAVVGVEGATHRIGDGQRVRVHGSEGYVEVLG